MSNLLKSKPDDLTPQGSNPTTIVQKIIEICQSGSKSSRTGTELTSIKEHQNSVFTYKGQPATYVSGADGKFTFAVIDISGESPVMHTYSVDGQKNITQGADVAFGGELPKGEAGYQLLVASKDSPYSLEVKKVSTVNGYLDDVHGTLEEYFDRTIGAVPIAYTSKSADGGYYTEFSPNMLLSDFDIHFTADASDEPYNTGVTYTNEKFNSAMFGTQDTARRADGEPQSPFVVSPKDAVKKARARGYANISGGIKYTQPTGLWEWFRVEAEWTAFIDYTDLMVWAQSIGLTFPQDMPPAPDTTAIAMLLSTPVNREAYHKAWIVYPYEAGTGSNHYFKWGYVNVPLG